MLTNLYNWLRGLFDHELVLLTIVRRYQDAQGHNVGELYQYETWRAAGAGMHRLIGCSLDSFPLDLGGVSLLETPGALDLSGNDFLAYMAPNTLRVGAQEPGDNDSVRKHIRRIPRRNIRIVIQNRFVEHVMSKRDA